MHIGSLASFQMAVDYKNLSPYQQYNYRAIVLYNDQEGPVPEFVPVTTLMGSE